MLTLCRLALERIVAAILEDKLDASGHHFSEADSNLVFDLIRRETELTADIVLRLPSLRLTCVNLNEMIMTWEDLHVIRNQSLVSLDMGYLEESVKKMYWRRRGDMDVVSLLAELFENETSRRRLKHLSIQGEQDEWSLSRHWVHRLGALFKSLDSLKLINFPTFDLNRQFIETFRNLKTLDVTSTVIRSLRGIEQLKQLETLAVSDLSGLATVQDVFPLFELQNLRNLDISNNWPMRDWMRRRRRQYMVERFVECVRDHNRRLPNLEFLDVSNTLPNGEDGPTVLFIVETHPRLRTLKAMNRPVWGRDRLLMAVADITPPPTMKIFHCDTFSNFFECFVDCCRRGTLGRTDRMMWFAVELYGELHSDESEPEALRFCDLLLEALKTVNGRDEMMHAVLMQLDLLIPFFPPDIVEDLEERIVHLTLKAFRRKKRFSIWCIKILVFYIWLKIIKRFRNEQQENEAREVALGVFLERIDDDDSLLGYNALLFIMNWRESANRVCSILDDPASVDTIRANIVEFVERRRREEGENQMREYNEAARAMTTISIYREDVPPMGGLIEKLFEWTKQRPCDKMSILTQIYTLLQLPVYVEQLFQMDYAAILLDLRVIGYDPNTPNTPIAQQYVQFASRMVTMLILFAENETSLDQVIVALANMQYCRDDIIDDTIDGVADSCRWGWPGFLVRGTVGDVEEYNFKKDLNYVIAMFRRLDVPLLVEWKHKLLRHYTFRKIPDTRHNNEMCWLGFQLFYAPTASYTSDELIEGRTYSIRLIRLKMREASDVLGVLDRPSELTTIRANLMEHMEVSPEFGECFEVLKYVNSRPDAPRMPGFAARLLGWLPRHDRCELILQYLFEQFRGPADVEEFQTLDFSAVSHHIDKVSVPTAIFYLTGIFYKLVLWTRRLPTLELYDKMVISMIQHQLTTTFADSEVTFVVELLRGARTPGMVAWALWSIRNGVLGDRGKELQPFVNEIRSTRKLGDIQLDDQIVRLADAISADPQLPSSLLMAVSAYPFEQYL